MTSMTTLSNSPSKKNSISSTNATSTTSELLLTASALNGSSPASITTDSFSSSRGRTETIVKKDNVNNPSLLSSRNSSNNSSSDSTVEITYTRLHSSNLEVEETSTTPNFLKMSPLNCASSSSSTKYKEEGEKGPEEDGKISKTIEVRENNDEDDDEEQFSTKSTLNQEMENDGDLATVSETSQSYSCSQLLTDSNFHTPSSSLHNLASLDAESPAASQEKKDISAIIELQEESEEIKPTPSSVKTEEYDVVLTPESPNLNLTESSNSNASGLSINVENKSQSFSPISPQSEFSRSVESNNSRDDDFVSSGNYASSASNKEGCSDLLQPGNYNTKPTKKKMWYHVFTPSYKSRVGDFKKNFKDLQQDEKLIVDYSCAIQKDILVQGRMYVSQNHICFHANIFGWETQTVIKFKEITSITKEKTALVIPNAIQVSTDNDKYFFTSFVTRDAAYLMLFKLWQSALVLEEGLSPKEIWKLVRTSYGDDGISSEVEGDEFMPISPSDSNLTKAASVSTLMSLNSEADDKSIDIEMIGTGSLLPQNESQPDSIRCTEKSEVLTNGIRRRAAAEADLSDSSDSETEIELRGSDKDKLTLEIPKCPADHSGQGRELVNAIIPCDVDTLFTMLFTNSKFYLDFHTSRKTFDIVQSEWEESLEESKKIRQVSFTVTLNQVMGPKHSQLSETQTMYPESKPGRMYAIDLEAVNSGIPYADSFYVTAHYCLSRVSAQQSRLIIISQIKYRKSIWGVTKSFIERNSWAGMTEFYNHLERALKEECLKSNVSPPASPRLGVPSAGPIRRPARKKYPAPAIPVDIAIAAAKIRTGSLGRSVVPPTAANTTDLDSSLPEGSFLLKIILTILAGLLLLNAFLYLKLASLESSASAPLLSLPEIQFPDEIPQTHQDWLLLLQKQESLHRLEIQKWHDILLSALKILKQAEMDLETLKLHVATYSNTRLNGELLRDHPLFQSMSTNNDNIKSTVTEY